MNDRRREVSLARAQLQREQWAETMAEQDRDLLDLRAEGKTFRAIATILGISHSAAHYRVLAAERREKTRQEMASA